MLAEVLVGVLVGAAVLCPTLGRGRAARSVVATTAADRTFAGTRPTGERPALSRHGSGGRSGFSVGLAPWRARGGLRWWTRRGGRAPDADLVPLVVAQVSALLRSGAAPGRAWRQAADVSTEVTGVPNADDLARCLGSVSAASAVAAACRLAAEVGAPVVGVLDRVADVIADEARAEAERNAAFAGPRMTARVLGWLPLVGVALGVVLGVDPITTALDGGAGTVAAGLGVVFLVAGRRWSAVLIARAREAGGER